MRCRLGQLFVRERRSDDPPPKTARASIDESASAFAEGCRDPPHCFLRSAVVFSPTMSGMRFAIDVVSPRSVCVVSLSDLGL